MFQCSFIIFNYVSVFLYIISLYGDHILLSLKCIFIKLLMHNIRHYSNNSQIRYKLCVNMTEDL